MNFYIDGFLLTTHTMLDGHPEIHRRRELTFEDRSNFARAEDEAVRARAQQ